MNVALLSLVAALLAGVASTLLELWWLRVATGALPGTLPAVALVVPAFLLAWTLGSALAGRLADRASHGLWSASRWLAVGAATIVLAPWLLTLLRGEGTPAGAVARLLVGALPVAPAAFCLAGALPRLAAVRARQGLPPLRATGAVAAAVAAGGALGCAWLVPVMFSDDGVLTASAAALAGAALCCLVLAPFEPVGRPADPPAEVPASEVPAASRGQGWALALLVALGGGLLIAGQLGLLRLITHRHGDSIVNTAQVVGAVHVGMAVGAALLAWVPRVVPPGVLVSGLLLVTGLALSVPDVFWRRADSNLGVLLLVAPLGLGAGSLVTAASRAGVRTGGRFGSRLGSWVGDLAALSTLGGLAAGVAFTWSWSVDPDLGTTLVLQMMARTAVVAAAAAGLLTLWLGRGGPARSLGALATAAGVGAAFWVWPASVPELPWHTAPDEVELLRQVEGPYGVVSLVATSDGGSRLKLDGVVGLGGSSQAATDRRMGRMAGAFAPNAGRVLMLGLGYGHTVAGLAGATPGRIDCVERNGQVLQMELPLPVRPGDAPVEIIHADARAWAAEHSDTYDLVVGDLFVPWFTGAGDLLTREQFLMFRRTLKPHGTYVQWLPLHQLSWPAFGAVALAFVEAFPSARLFVATPLSGHPLVALVGTLDQDLPGIEEFDAVLGARPAAEGPNGAGDLVDSYVTDNWALHSRFAGGPVNTPRHPWSELLSLGRQRDEADMAAVNLRLLAEMVQPLDTSSLRRRPVDEKERRELGRQFAARADVLGALLRARATTLELAAPESEDPARQRLPEEREALARELRTELLGAWARLPGHPTTRTAIIERGRVLQSEGRLQEMGSLLESALVRGDDGPLAGAYGGALLAVGRDEQALAVLRVARELTPRDRTVLIHLGSALVRTGADAEARAVLEQARQAFGSGGFPPLQGVVLALLDGTSGAREAGRAVLAALPANSPWRSTFERLTTPPSDGED